MSQITSYKVIETLQSKGYQALYAGGCVRDMLLGIKPKDFDIVTNALPDEVENIFPKTIPIGKEFGIIMAIVDDHEFEIATFRKDSDSSDGRRPDEVMFTEAKEDAQRRDFTINGIFMDPVTTEILDFVGGKEDLDMKVVRFIGDPSTRIQEDHLRMLRAVRFKNNLDFQYHPETFQAIKQHSHLILDISQERIQQELVKMLRDKNRHQSIKDLEDLGLLEHILPEIQAMKGIGQPPEFHKEGDTFDHTMLCLQKMPEGLNDSLYWAVMFHDCGKADTFDYNDGRITFYDHASVSGDHARNRLRKLRFSKRFIDHVAWLCDHHMTLFQIFDLKKETRIKWYRKEWFLDLLEVHKYDVLGTIPSDLSNYHKIEKMYDEETSHLPPELPKLISGKDVMDILNIEPGPKVQEVLDKIHEQQLLGEVKTKINALDYIKSIKV